MPLLNITIDDASPLIKYQPDGAWNQTVSDDAYADGYTNTTWQGASATFEFEGTWIKVTGSKNDYHRNYTVILDGHAYPLNGFAPHPGVWNATLFTSDDVEPPLVDGYHTLIISNDDWWTLDIDSITWTTNVGRSNDTGTTLQTTTVDDAQNAFSWLPHGAWNTNPSNLAMFSQGTGHSTSQVDASVNYTFSGDAVSIYGSVGPGYSRYSVQPPDRPAREFDAARDTFSPHMLLYYHDGFGPGNHTITLVNEGPGLFQIDYAVVHDASVLSTSPSPGPPLPIPSGTPIIPPDPDPSIHTSLGTGVIVAITFIALLFIFLIAALLFLLQRNKTLWYRLQRGYKVQSQFDIGTPPHGSVTPLLFTAAPPMRSKANLRRDTDEDLETQHLNRAFTTESRLTASTLVADAGSNDHRFSLKPLRLASRWGFGTPASSQTDFSRSPITRNSASTRHLTLSPPSRHLSHSPSARHLLQEESQYYDPYTAAVAGLEEVPEDGVEEILRHPIHRNEPSIPRYQHWQSSLP